MIFRGAPEHGRSADVDIFYSLRKRHIRLGNGFLKGIEINHDQIDRIDSVSFHVRNVRHIVTNGKNTTVYFWMQGLYPAIHYFRKTGICINGFHGYFIP